MEKKLEVETISPLILRKPSECPLYLVALVLILLPLCLPDQTLDLRHSCKYLGVFISGDCCDDSDISRQRRSLYVHCIYVSMNFKACSHSVKCTLITYFCSNNIYDGHCWFRFKTASVKNLFIAFNNSFR